MAQVRQERDEPGAAEEPAGVTHGVPALDAGPVGEGRTVQDERTGQVGTVGAEERHGPTGLAVADHCRLFRMGMAPSDLLDEADLRLLDVRHRLPRHRLRMEKDEVNRVAPAPGRRRFPNRAWSRRCPVRFPPGGR